MSIRAPHCELVRNALRLLFAFRIHQVGIKISGHQDLVPVRSMPDGCSNVLYGKGVSGGDIIPQDMPLPPPCHKLEADDFRTVEAELVNGEVLRLLVEDCDVSATSAWCRRRRRCHRHLKEYCFLTVNSVGELGFLQFNN